MKDYSDKSFWLATYGEYVPNEALHNDIKVDVAIIGGGYTGLSTAFNLRKDDQGLTVAVLEGEVVGFGASGRNGGFSMTLFGLEPAVTKTIFGHQRTVEAHHYMERSVDYVDQLIKEHNIQSDYWFPGFLRAATTPGYVKRIQHDLEILTSIPDPDRRSDQARAELVFWRLVELRSGLFNPAKQARELKRLAMEFGAQVYEETPVLNIVRGADFVLTTHHGKVTAKKIIFATNAYSHLIPQLKRKQVPAFTHMVVTEPLSKEQLDPMKVNRQD
jgi:glycine/D-amino acid oxidase-like deaminating enzyme